MRALSFLAAAEAVKGGEDGAETKSCRKLVESLLGKLNILQIAENKEEKWKAAHAFWDELDKYKWEHVLACRSILYKPPWYFPRFFFFLFVELAKAR